MSIPRPCNIHPTSRSLPWQSTSTQFQPTSSPQPLVLLQIAASKDVVQPLCNTSPHHQELHSLAMDTLHDGLFRRPDGLAEEHGSIGGLVNWETFPFGMAEDRLPGLSSWGTGDVLPLDLAEDVGTNSAMLLEESPNVSMGDKGAGYICADMAIGEPLQPINVLCDTVHNALSDGMSPDPPIEGVTFSVPLKHHALRTPHHTEH